MRIRQVKPEFWNDATMVDLPLDVRLVYIGLWMEADDSGWLRWEPRQIVLDLFPRIPEADALALLRTTEKALTRRGCLIRHKCGHAVVPRLTAHQRFAGLTKQVHTFAREHQQRCTPQEDRGTPAGHPGDPRPVRNGMERGGEASHRAHAHEEPTSPPSSTWKPKDEKHLNSPDIPIRDNARKAAEAAGIDWRALLEAKGEKPNP